MPTQSSPAPAQAAALQGKPVTPTAPAPQAPVLPTPPHALTRHEVSNLLARRSELNTQITSVNEQRSALASQLNNAGDPVSRAGLETRIQQFDQRMVQLQTDMADVGRQLSSTTNGLTSGTTIPPFNAGNLSDNGAAIGSVITIFVLAPIAFAYARRLWKRSDAPAHPRESPDTAQRLERMEQALDTIAIEIERVSENQRFLTRVLTERTETAADPLATATASAPLALGAGDAPFEPVRVRDRDAAPVSRRDGN